MVKIKAEKTSKQHNGFTENVNNENSFSDSLNRTPGGNQHDANLWDNEELVMKALRIYGKMPRPQVFNEISRVCKLSNLRKSRYFHEKMMKNNPFKDKILQLLAEEGEQTYPYFKIFFEEYKTKKQRQSLINCNDNTVNQVPMKTDSAIYEYNNIDNSVGCHSNDLDTNHSNQVYFNNEAVDNDYDYDHIDYNDNPDYQEDCIVQDENCPDVNNTDFNTTESPFDITYGYRCGGNESGVNTLTSVIDTNAAYLENLELKFKLLTKEKDRMKEYFEIFTDVVEGLKNEIEKAAGGLEAVVEEKSKNLDKTVLKKKSLEQISEELAKTDKEMTDMDSKASKLAKEQANLRAQLKITRNLANIENMKLHNEVDECRAELMMKDEEIRNLKRRLEEAMRQKREVLSKGMSVQSTAVLTRTRLTEMKESMDRLFDQINGLTSVNSS